MKRQRPRKREIRRRVLLEQMEKRIPLAADVGHNFLMPGDVNDDHFVKSSDALAIMNMLRQQYEADTDAVDASLLELFCDVNDDGKASARDAIQVINQLDVQRESTAASTLLEADGVVRARIELEVKGNGNAEFEVRLTGAPANQALDVKVDGETLGQIQTDNQGRGKLELKYGGSNPEIPAVLANANAATPVEIGDVVTGTLGSLGELEMSDGGSDGLSDAASDAISDANSDASSDGNPDDPAGSSDDTSPKPIAVAPATAAVTRSLASTPSSADTSLDDTSLSHTSLDDTSRDDTSLDDASRDDTSPNDAKPDDDGGD